jgi:hypothetical protein
MPAAVLIADDRSSVKKIFRTNGRNGSNGFPFADKIPTIALRVLTNDDKAGLAYK